MRLATDVWVFKFLRMNFLLLLTFGVVSLCNRLAAEAEPRSCLLEIEDVSYLRDAQVMQQMDQVVLQARREWDLLSAEEGKVQLEACKGQKAACELPAPQRRRLSPSAIYQAGCEGTLVVGRLYLCENCDKVHFRFSNTAFAISEDGYCVMNFHCLEAYRGQTPGVRELHGFAVRTWDGRHYPISEIVSGSEAQDVIIVKVDLPEGESLQPLPLGDGAEVGDTVYTLSHPQGMLYRFSRGMVTRNAVSHPHGPAGQEERPRMCISAEYGVGSSGGPVLDERGNVVGVISSTSTVFTDGEGRQRQPQMVERQTIPVGLLRRLIESNRSGSAFAGGTDFLEEINRGNPHISP
jgi:hypothetical protein